METAGVSELDRVPIGCCSRLLHVQGHRIHQVHRVALIGQPARVGARPPTDVEDAGGRPGQEAGQNELRPRELEPARPAEETRLLDLFGSVGFEPVVMRGQAAKRTVRHFGLRYDYEGGELEPAGALPEPLLPLRDRAAALMERDPGDLVEVLLSRYPPGAGIGWHRDAPMFGSKVAGVSLGAPARMRFQRRVRGEREVAELDLAPRSAYLLSGAARWSWQHSIPATKALRYSLTFRTLRRDR
jgi:alkylated DNA repair dioxygenase AlkB